MNLCGNVFMLQLLFIEWLCYVALVFFIVTQGSTKERVQATFKDCVISTA